MADQPIFDRPLEQLFVNLPPVGGFPAPIASIPISIPVPDLVGEMLEEAQRKLKHDTGGRLNLVVSSIVLEAGLENEVRSQEPKAGDLAAQGSSVRVVLRRNPDAQEASVSDVLDKIEVLQKSVDELPVKTQVEVIVENELNAKLPDRISLENILNTVKDALSQSGLSAEEVAKIQTKLDTLLGVKKV
jgi:PASTA domain